MKRPQYYLTKISELADTSVQQVFAELCSLQHPPWDLNEHSNLTCFGFLSHYFRGTLAGKVTLKHVVPGSLLDGKVSSFSGSELYKFCKELASQNGKLFEGEENRKLLPFLQQIFGKGATKKYLRSR